VPFRARVSNSRSAVHGRLGRMPSVGAVRGITRDIGAACVVVSSGGITRPAAKLICARFIWVFESALRFP
jgi:hypothetical protein